MSTEDHRDTEPRRLDGGSDGGRDLREPLAELAELLTTRFERVSGALKTLVAVHTDRAQLAIRKRIQIAILGLVGALAGGSVTVYAAIVFVRGVAGGFTELFGGRAWLGSLASGALFLCLVGGGVGLSLRRWNRKEFVKQRAKYEKLREQRGNVPERVREPAP